MSDLWPDWLRDEDGVTSLELAILYPLVLMIILGMFQISLYWHAANTAEAAAERGVAIGRVDHGDEATATNAAEAEALKLLSAATRLDNEVVRASISTTDDLITVTVAVDAPRLIGAGTWRVQSVAQGRLERFVPADER